MTVCKQWRHLTENEVQRLIQQQNSADDWNDVQVTDTFCIEKIRNCHFQGQTLIGNDVALNNVQHVENYHFDDGCFVEDVYKMVAANDVCASFHFPIEVRNEDGRRDILASPDMTIAGAYLMSECHKDALEYEKLASLKSDFENNDSEIIGYVGKDAHVEHVGRLENVWIGEGAVLEDCSLLKNVFVHSSNEEPTHIGVNVILSNVILDNGCQVDTGAMARNTLLGCHVGLSDYVRVSHSVVGDNAHLACCEVQHSMIFPFHEQHHNNSFLISSFLKGQSNLAAGATVGSNHNGRTADCELTAGRGFWPGLCTSIKFPSCFASYSLLAKGAYPHEICSPFPFALLNNNVTTDELEIMPAYWWMYNTYALFRNAWKFNHRDQRKKYSQNIHYELLAPDTVIEIIRVLPLMEQYVTNLTFDLEIEHSKRNVRLLKAEKALTAYREMLLYYVLKTLHPLFVNAKQSAEYMNELLHKINHTVISQKWENVGGQLVLIRDKDAILKDLRSGVISSWQDFHTRLNELNGKYVVDNQNMAMYILHQLLGRQEATILSVKNLMTKAVSVTQHACERAVEQRRRDKDIKIHFSHIPADEDIFNIDFYVDNSKDDAVIAHLQKLLEDNLPQMKDFYDEL